MSNLVLLPSAALEIPVMPSEEDWRDLSPTERQDLLVAATEALCRQAELMPEGRPHATARTRAAAILGEFFRSIGRTVYLASDLPVAYPLEEIFAPDLIAINDVPDLGEDDPRLAWVVADEGRGVDLALEITFQGDRQKDLVTNVARYARLGIREYFVYDRLKHRLYGHRLLPGRRYEAIPSREGLLPSEVLGLELGVVQERLRFFYGGAQIPDAQDRIARLDAIMVERERQIEQEMEARVAAEQRAARETSARVEAESARAEAENARADAEARAATLAAQVAELQARLGALERVG